MLNSRNPYAKGFKKPLRANNRHYWEEFLLSVPGYFKSIRDSKGNLIVKGRRKTARTASTFNYVLTYKMSQGHLASGHLLVL